MEKHPSYERVLIGTALLLCALLVIYNAFFIPQAEPAVIHFPESQAEISAGSKSALSQSGRLNLNTATARELADLLPDVDEETAEKIIAYRERAGKFYSLEELKNIEEMAGDTFRNVLPYLYI